MKDHGRGAIGIPCREQGRWTPFWQCVHRLERPPGCRQEPIVQYDNSVARARNEIARQALREGLDWVLFLDDDQLFGASVLMQLLAHPVSIVLGLTMLRCSHDGVFRPIWSDQPMTMVGGTPAWQPVNAIVTNDHGLMPLTSGTGGGVLIRRAVFEAIDGPWWQMGQYDPEMFWEDIFFYDRARAAGFAVWGDPQVRFGHYQPTVLWPHQRADGTWSTVLAHKFDGFLEQPWVVASPLVAVAT